MVILAPLGALAGVFLCPSFTPLAGEQPKCCTGRDRINKYIIKQIFLMEKQRWVAWCRDNQESVCSSYSSRHEDTTPCPQAIHPHHHRYRTSISDHHKTRWRGIPMRREYGRSSSHPEALPPAKRHWRELCRDRRVPLPPEVLRVAPATPARTHKRVTGLGGQPCHILAQRERGWRTEVWGGKKRAV